MGRPGGPALFAVPVLGTLAAPARTEIAVSGTGGTGGKVAPLGSCCHGNVRGLSGRTSVTPCRVERMSLPFAFDGAELKPTGTIRMKTDPARIRNAEPGGGTTGGSEDDNG